ncbi:MAG: phosphotransferase [Actinomycetota bacterium]
MLKAIFTPPQLEHFLSRFDLKPDHLESSFDGWHKRAVLAPDRAFLFPRYEGDVQVVEREAVALDAVASVTVAPRLLGLHRDERISPYPFLEVERRFGTLYDDVEDELTVPEIRSILRSLGAATATWHQMDTSAIRDPVDRLPSWDKPIELSRQVVEAWWAKLDAFLPADLSPRAAAVERWVAVLRPLADLAPVLTHGDVHETQILLDDAGNVSTVLDWDHAAVAHPLRDFNFGEWGYGIFRHEAHFDVLYESYWEGYRSARNERLPDFKPLLLFRALSDAVWVADKLLEQPSSWFHAHRMSHCLDHINRAVS